MHKGSLQDQVDFTRIRYAQCWEDADVLLEAAGLTGTSRCLSIASAGDNTLALLSAEPGEVVALDINPAQLACLALRVAAYRTLSHAELLEFVGSRPCRDRKSLYRRCRKSLSGKDREFWDGRPADIERGIGVIGRFEAYFEMFRRRLLPVIHRRATISELTRPKARERRERFYTDTWNNWRWRILFQVFFSRLFMGRVGRDPELFRYVEGSVAGRILERTKHALTVLDPALNPYLCWILHGDHRYALPCALRAENFDPIRDNLNRLHWHCASLEDYLAAEPAQRFDFFNLSDIFEYASEPEYTRLLQHLLAAANPGARLVYWNMLVPRSRPRSMGNRLAPLTSLASRLHAADKAFFYSRLVIEEVMA
jgi:S-adenosylmethionine-diacylglycerol 3-amino-3-carboxypropyl transferase